MQYENSIWNEYFTNRLQLYEQQLKGFRNQFQQLDDYFKAHDSNYNYDPQSKCRVYSFDVLKKKCFFFFERNC